MEKTRREKVIEKLSGTSHKEYMEKFPEGSIVYFLKKCRYTSGYSVILGIVDKVMWNEIYIDFLTAKRDCLLNGKPLEEYSFPTEWEKLPKGWNLNKDLFTISNVVSSESKDFVEMSVHNPEDILRAYEEGKLVKISENEIYGLNFIIEAEVEKERYRLKKHYISDSDYTRGYTRKSGTELFTSFADACGKKKKLEHDSEWLETIEDAEILKEDYKNIINRWAEIYSIPDNIKARIYRYILSKNLENIDIRMFDKHIEWRYINNNCPECFKKWKPILY